jgi:Mg2+ and Co2+ transporter CorA
MTDEPHNMTLEYLKAIRADMKRMLDKQDHFEKLLLQTHLANASLIHEQSFLTKRIAELDGRLERVEVRLDIHDPLMI